MSHSWILVADSSQFTVYDAVLTELLNDKGNLTLLHEEQHPASRQKKHDMVSDKMGHHRSKGANEGDFVSRTDPKEYELESFSRDISDFLEKKRVNNAFTELVLIAPDQLHGMLNKHLGNQVKLLIREKIHKNYTHLKPHELKAQLSKILSSE